MSDLAPSPKRRKGGFLGWWASELRGLGDGRRLRRFVAGRPRLIVALQDDATLILEESARGRLREVGRLPGGEQGLDGLGEAMQQLSRRLRGLPLGIRLPRHAALVRDHVLPVEAASQSGRILDVEFEARSPFRSDEVYRDHFVEPVAKDAARVRAVEVILKRERGDALLQRLADQGVRPIYLDVFSATPPEGIPINLLAPQTGVGVRRGFPAVRLLAVLALALGAAAYYGHTARLSREIALLDADIAAAQALLNTARAEAAETGARNAQTFALMERKLRQRHASAIIEQLSRDLPDGTWLTEFRLSGSDAVITGFSPQAAALVQLIERSPLFEAATLEGSVTYNERLQRERFSIRARVSDRLAFNAGVSGGEDKRT